MNFMQGTLDVLILTALADGPRHGYDVVEWIRTETHGAIKIDDGALYTSLHRMEKRGWLGHEWLVSPKGRRAKYYHLSREGRHELRAGERRWHRFATAVARLFAASQKAGYGST
jgi:PadR family transcriptional regulator, regulatory protein PadR